MTTSNMKNLAHSLKEVCKCVENDDDIIHVIVDRKTTLENHILYKTEVVGQVMLMGTVDIYALAREFDAQVMQSFDRKDYNEWYFVKDGIKFFQLYNRSDI